MGSIRKDKNLFEHKKGFLQDISKFIDFLDRKAVKYITKVYTVS